MFFRFVEENPIFLAGARLERLRKINMMLIFHILTLQFKVFRMNDLIIRFLSK